MRVHIVALYNVPSKRKRQDVCSVVKRASGNSSTEDSLANIQDEQRRATKMVKKEFGGQGV